MKLNRWLVVTASCAPLIAGAAQAEVTQDSFLLRQASDLVDMCSAAQSDPLYTAATNFCHGFAVGVFRVLQQQDAARRSGHLFCVPTPAPTRNEAIAGFVQWARANVSRMGLSPADGVAAFLSEQYKCPRGR
jgi:Rap1a immunity proteins